jgi:hypothetical protein
MEVSMAGNIFVDEWSFKSSVRSKFGNYGRYKSKYFTEEQLEAMTEVVCYILQQYSHAVDVAIAQATPTKEQIHQLFLDKLLENKV